MGTRSVLVAIGVAVLVAGCSSDESSDSTSSIASTASTAAADLEPTVCATGEPDGRPVVSIDVDDDSDGFGRFGTRTPNPLRAGPVSLAVDAAYENPDPVSLTVTGPGDSNPVFEFVAVAPGFVCRVDLELVAGDYTVTYLDKTKTFTVTPQP